MTPGTNTLMLMYVSRTTAIAVTGRRGLYGGLDNRLTNGSEVVTLTYRPRCTSQKLFFYLWYSFLLEVQ
jgi:hypothetical protein